MNNTNNKVFPTYYQEFIYKSRYSRWLEEEGRRENWDETVSRYVDFMESHLLNKHQFKLPFKLKADIYHHIYTLSVMPSMRALMTAGPALARDNTAGYNCAYLTVNSPRSFDEAMYILMCGTGVGFSVERQYVNQLPEVPTSLTSSERAIVIEDSKEGWARGLRELIESLYKGEIPKWDTSKVRKAGERLKTFGGRASGPAPLEDLFSFIVAIFRSAQGRKLRSIECHDIMCKIGEVVVVGGVRRSAMISLSNLSDDRMRTAKSGAWWENNKQRALSNNSVSYTEKPDVNSFMKEFLSLYESKSGERGIFSRVASKKQAAKNGRRDPNWEFGTNPCSEIILRPNQFCNLTEVVVRPTDTFESLKEKVYIASVLGTLQSTLTDFPYLSEEWKNNTEEERLLGVSLTGIMDHMVLADGPDGDAFDTFSARGEHLGDILDSLKNIAINANKELAGAIGINQSTAITCVKPSGTVSQLADSASGIHGRYAPYYIRTVRGDIKDPITQFLKDQGVPSQPCVAKPNEVVVFSFPIKSPEGSFIASEVSAIQQLEHWLTYQTYWCEHKPSVTVYVKEEEWPEVQAWVWKHFDSISGVSFLPYSEHSYEQAPYQPCTKEEYEEFVAKMPSGIDWTKLSEYEKEDNTVGMQTMACSGGHCEIVDLI
jgi:ribonucleoside-diphosphate reductase alpha chain